MQSQRNNACGALEAPSIYTVHTIQKTFIGNNVANVGFIQKTFIGNNVANVGFVNSNVAADHVLHDPECGAMIMKRDHHAAVIMDGPMMTTAV